jgi:hypothetical protein
MSAEKEFFFNYFPNVYQYLKKEGKEKQARIMVLLTLVDGKKGPNDILVLVTAYNEALTFSEFLFLAKCYLDSEDEYYPIKEGYIGKAMLMNALNEVALGVDFEQVLKRYKLKRKGKNLKIIDKRLGNNIEWKTKRSLEQSYSRI